MAQEDHIVLKIEGMDCSSCALNISKVIERKGSTNVNVNFTTGEATFDLREKSLLPVIKEDIRRLGYTVVNSGQDHAHHEHSHMAGVEKKFYFCLLFTLPLFLHMFADIAVLHNPYVQLALCIPVFIVGLLHFGKSAWASVRMLSPNMDVLIFIGSASAFFYSLAGMVLYAGSHLLHSYLFFETSATIITLVLLGNVLEHRSVKQTTTAIRELSALQAVKARRVRMHEGHESLEEVDLAKISPGDLLQVNTGDKVPVDGELVSGSASLDESMISGESLPVEKTTGSKLIGGTLVANGNFRMRAEQVGSETVLSKIIDMVKNAQNLKPSIQKLGDRVSAVFVPVVLGIALVTFLGAWLLFDLPARQALMNSIAVLVISCPCAMGLATPTAIMAGIGRAARNGVLIKGGSTLEELAKVRLMVFDKTGTLTTGNFRIGKINLAEGASREEVQDILLQLEQRSSHPIARSIVSALEGQVEKKLVFTEVREEKGLGISARDKDGNHYQAGSYRLAADLTPDKTHAVYVIRNSRLLATVDLEDELKANVKETISALRSQGIEPVMLSGDTAAKAEAVARAAGIDTVYSEKLPDEKLAIISELAAKQPVAMVGDGINDAPALARATVGISISNATQIAIQSAQVILLKGKDLSQLGLAHRISRHTLLTVKQNLFWAFFYNVIAIPVAAMGYLSPMIGALAMAFSDVIVIGNSIRLKTKKLS
ncbi:MAG: cation-translocating P-type ATPase [Bacteroidota bacterium]